MLSLKATLKAIGESITTIKTALDGKASREWTYVGTTQGTLTVPSGYSEALIGVGFGGVLTTELVPTSNLPTTVMFLNAWQSKAIYVTWTGSTMKISQQPNAYIADLYLWVR